MPEAVPRSGRKDTGNPGCDAITSPTPGAPSAHSLSSIYFYLTEGCNLRCRHCWISPKYQAEGRQYAYLSPGLFGQIIDQALPLGLRTAKLTGGEPLLHPQVTEMLGTIRNRGIRLVLETNGVLCTPEISRAIASCQGCSVSVSIDGTDPETHEWIRGVPGCFDDTLRGFRNLVESGLRPQVIMTVMRRNIGQAEGMIGLARSLGAGSVKFNMLQPTERGEVMHRSGECLTIREMIELGKKIDDLTPMTGGPTVYYSQPPVFRPLGKMLGTQGCGHGVCGIKGIIGVLSDGSYAMCGIGESKPGLVFGHAASDSLKDVWEGSPVLNMIRDGLPDKLEGICKKCIFKRNCLGSCVAQNYYRSNSLWSPFWYCEEAEKAGLFPRTRIFD